MYRKLDNNKICCFGTGLLFKQCFEQIILTLGKKPDYLCDNSTNKHNTYFNGIEILSPEKLLDIKGELLIIITVKNYEPIYNQLEQIGFKNIATLNYDRSYNIVNNIKFIKKHNLKYDNGIKLPNLKNKWALVTGSSRGIGYHITLALAKKGINIIAHSSCLSHNQEIISECNKLNVKTLSVAASLENQIEINKMLQFIDSSVGNVDIVYNNAAVSLKQPNNIWDIDVSVYMKTYQINTIAPIIIASHFAPKMIKNSYGRIINITSSIFNRPYEMAYSCSKAALDKFVCDIIPSIDNNKVLYAQIDPGWLKTDMGGEEALFEANSVLPGALLPILLENFSNGKWFTAQDFANLNEQQALNKYHFLNEDYSDN
jgi:short-subunit dehydrogenase